MAFLHRACFTSFAFGAVVGMVVMVAIGTKETPSGVGVQICPPGSKTSTTAGVPAVRVALHLLRLHESVNGTQMVGDGGLARGWLHQHEDHWNEGCKFLDVDWPWPEDTRNLAKCEAVAMAYWRLYSPEYMNNVEELIRRFRLPFDPYRPDNDEYLRRVMQ